MRQGISRRSVGFYASLVVFGASLGARPAAANTTIALFGDGVTRGLNADSNLGQEGTPEAAAALVHFALNAEATAYLPNGEWLLNYPLMRANDAAARDALAAVQGTASYSLVTRLATWSGGQAPEVMNMAFVGGSYRTAEAQLATYKMELAAHGMSSPDLIIVDLGRTDWQLFTAPQRFQREVSHFFRELTSLSPHSRLLVTGISDLPSLLTRPDRVAVKFGDLGQTTCAELDAKANFGGGSGLHVGADNRAVLPAARARLAAFNGILAEEVAAYQQRGGRAVLVDPLPELSGEQGDMLLSADCLDPNQAGLEQMARHLWPAAVQLLSGPAPKLQDIGAKTDSQPLSARGEALWQEYVASEHVATLQPECRPQLSMPPAGVPYRGVAFLVHGFSACPQHFSDVVAPLNAAGFAVVLPVAPGQGRQWHLGADGSYEDQVDEIPVGRLGLPSSYRQRYGDFVARMNELASEFSGEHAVGGISLGGALATAIALAAPAVWDRQLIMNPFYEDGEELTRAVIGAVANGDWANRQLGDLADPVLAQRFNWGESCDDLRRPGPVKRKLRAGICQFKLTSLLGINQFGFETWSLLRPTTIKTQFVGVQGDILVSEQLMFNGVGRMRGEELDVQPYTSAQRLDTHPDVRICYVPSDSDVCTENESKAPSDRARPCVTHAMLLGYDSPTVSPYWVPMLITKMVDFLANGKHFAADSATRAYGDPLCADFPRS